MRARASSTAGGRERTSATPIATRSRARARVNAAPASICVPTYSVVLAPIHAPERVRVCMRAIIGPSRFDGRAKAKVTSPPSRLRSALSARTLLHACCPLPSVHPWVRSKLRMRRRRSAAFPGPLVENKVHLDARSWLKRCHELVSETRRGD